jgi:hypothetical protein
MSKHAAHQPSLQDVMVDYLRQRPAGAPAADLAREFLKLQNPGHAIAARAVAGILACDRRCFSDERGLWHAAAGGVGPTLRELPWSALFCLTDPDNRRVFYAAVWEVVPAPSCVAAGWLLDPGRLPYDEHEQLLDGGDVTYDAESAGRLPEELCRAGNGRILALLSSRDRSLLAATCADAGTVLPDDTVVVRDLLRAAGLPAARPLTLDTLEKTVFGASHNGATARRQAERFAAAVAELLEQCSRKGVENREALDRISWEEKAALFRGKAFSYNDLLALPAACGVYGFKDRSGSFLYIGKAANLKRRLLSYFCETDESPAKIKQLLEQSHGLVTQQYGSELECLIYEYRLIRKYAPPLNRQTGVNERKGTFRPINDCILLLPHVRSGMGMSVWFRERQKILLKPFTLPFPASGQLATEINAFFFTSRLPPDSNDFPEQEIVFRWIRQHEDSLTFVPVSRMSCAEEICDAMRIAWRDLEKERTGTG